MMMKNEVIARIDVSTPTGRKIVRDLENRRVVKLEYPLPEGIEGKTYTHEEVFGNLRAKLKEHYDVK